MTNYPFNTIFSLLFAEDDHPSSIHPRDFIHLEQPQCQEIRDSPASAHPASFLDVLLVAIFLPRQVISATVIFRVQQKFQR